MGEAPRARVAFADCVFTTPLVIYTRRLSKETEALRSGAYLVYQRLYRAYAFKKLSCQFD